MKDQYECHDLVKKFPQMPAIQNKAVCQSRDRISCIVMPVLREQIPQGTESSMLEKTDLLFNLFYWKK